MNYKLKTRLGNTITKVAEEAKDIAIEKDVIVEFDFNGITCLVDKKSNTEWLVRDYQNAHLMDWKVIGVDYKPYYGTDIKREMDKRNKESELRAKQQAEKWEREKEQEKTLFNNKVKGINIELKDADGWKESRDSNKDAYGKCAMDFAEGWAKLMQVEMANGETLIECAEKTSQELSFYGITGFMYGCAVGILSQCWKHGEELRKWHNKEYSHEGYGVVNPALLTIK